MPHRSTLTVFVRRATLCMWLAAVACAGRRQSGLDPLDALLAAADAAWEDRAQIGLEAALEPLQQAYGMAPDDPKVLWRLVRHHHAAGLVEETPRAALYAWAEARSLGIHCIEQEPRVASARRTRGWDAALQLTTEEQAPCVAWTSLVWARWIANFGADAAATDLPTARAFAGIAEGLDDESKALGGWASAILDASGPDWAGGNTAAGLQKFEGLLKERPRDAVLHVDRLQWCGGLLSESYRQKAEAELAALPAATPEAAAAVARWAGRERDRSPQ